ncbi:MAG TPA: haloacid dehalogenase type II, partial [Polyangiaceae bacterium]|nr:haloacid dehalogenase type II [Polyangiaceae bacterium]
MLKRREFLLQSAAAGAMAPLLTSRAAAAAAARPGPVGARGVQLMVFDTFGTVVDWRNAVIAEGEKLGRDKGLTVDWPAFADAWRGGYTPALNRVRSGALPWTKLDVLHRMTLDDLIIRFKIDGLSEDEARHFNNVWHRLHGWPDAVAGLTRLRKQYVIAPLSNGNVSLLTDMAKFAGLPWDCILSTELVRHYKPDKETYLMPGEFWDLPPSAVMMVAAHPGDLDAAKALGLRTAYVHRPLENGPGHPSQMPQ